MQQLTCYMCVCTSTLFLLFMFWVRSDKVLVEAVERGRGNEIQQVNLRSVTGEYTVQVISTHLITGIFSIRGVQG